MLAASWRPDSRREAGIEEQDGQNLNDPKGAAFHERSARPPRCGGDCLAPGRNAFFVLLNGFFVATEFALVKVRATRIDNLAKEGNRSAVVVQHILKHMDRYLSACQLGITLASLILGALGEPAVSVLLIAALGGLGIEVAADATWVPIVSITIAFAVITVLHMTVGEQAPKMWALRRAESTALRTALPLKLFTWVFTPFIAVINSISNRLLRMAGLPAHHGDEATHTADEIRSMLALSWASGHLSKLEHDVAGNVFRIMELEVRHIVVPRIDVAYLVMGRPGRGKRRGHSGQWPQPLAALRGRFGHDHRLRTHQRRHATSPRRKGVRFSRFGPRRDFRPRHHVDLQLPHRVAIEPTTLCGRRGRARDRHRFGIPGRRTGGNRGPARRRVR